MNTPETINTEKYTEALNNLIGVDSAYMSGDKDVDAIVELIVAAKKLENRVKELEEENKKLNNVLEKERLDNAKVCDIYCRMINSLRKEVDTIKVETLRKMQIKLTNDEFKQSVDAYHYAYLLGEEDIEEIAEEILEEKNNV